ncbi:MAG TPA: carboxylesterase family protein [Candidatus Aquilonibacter sp.]|nr:carboxylesterase family protein [Candidatus Aquilonibacter sp.]
MVAALGLMTLLVGRLRAQVTIAIPGDPIRIDAGLVSGTMSPGSVEAYFGIPFAAPPLRENRWRAPQPVTPWKGVLTADRKPAECVQGLRSPTINHYFGDELAGEDCLYLNIWAPASSRRTDRRPVLVWIYGGGFTGGSASMPIYGGSELAKKGVIYVAPNYRLGVFGFLAHPDATKESGHDASGDWGLLDQVAALKWVQRNIAAFGGDPKNVTLLGQSAGSMSINDLQASPLAKGLFERAIGMSGATVHGGITSESRLADAEAQGLKLQQALKANSLDEMRGFSSDKVVAAAQAAGVRTGPIVDGYFLPDTVDNIFSEGKQNDVAVLTGSTAKDIGTTPPIRSAKTLAEYTALAAQEYGDKASEFLEVYPAHDDDEAVRQAEEVGENSGFALGARAWARAQTRTGKEPAYLYIFSHVQPYTPGVTFSDFNPATAGAYHMSDVPYWLGTYEAFNLFRRTRDWTAWDRELSDDMQDVIIAFAKTGNPSTGVVHFTRYDPANEMRVDFGDKITDEKLYTKGMDFLEANPVAPGRGGRGRGARGGGPNRGAQGSPSAAPPSPEY